MVKNFSKYTYPALTRDDTTGKRLYKTPENNSVPSVTTILSKTKDMYFLNEWKKRVGEDRANEIRTEAARVGTSMHLFLEHYVEDTVREYTPSPAHSQAKKMADVIVEKGLCYVSEVWGSEVQLYYEDQYAGTTDLIGLYKDTPYIIDFKQTNKPKKKDWVEDYFLQLCAYAHAHNHVTGSNIQNGIVLMCSRDLQFQEFEMNEIQFEKYTYMWFNRVEQYNKMAVK